MLNKVTDTILNSSALTNTIATANTANTTANAALPKAGGNMSGNQTFDNNRGVFGKNLAGVGKNLAILASDDTVYMGDTGHPLVVQGTTFKYGSSTVWTAGNDGAGSGLDADLLDGKNSTEFFQKNSDGGIIPITGSDLNTVTNSGFYDGDNLTNTPVAGSTIWWYVEVLRHNNANGYCLQRATQLNQTDATTDMYYRVQRGAIWGAWVSMGGMDFSKYTDFSGYGNVTVSSPNAYQTVYSVTGKGYVRNAYIFHSNTNSYASTIKITKDDVVIFEGQAIYPTFPGARFTGIVSRDDLLAYGNIPYLPSGVQGGTSGQIFPTELSSFISSLPSITPSTIGNIYVMPNLLYFNTNFKIEVKNTASGSGHINCMYMGGYK